MKLSILTATYNRAMYLNRLYESILLNLKDSNINAEWIIVDDGSTDDTKKIVKKWKTVNTPSLEVKYIYQNNSGKMKAINKGMREVTGDLVIDCDSDDYFAEYAFKNIEQETTTLLQEKELYALCFLKKDTKDNISRKEVFEKLFKNNYV